MHDSLYGKTVAISGGTGGIGQALCRELAARGAHLLLLDRNGEKAARCCKGCLRIAAKTSGSVRAYLTCGANRKTHTSHLLPHRSGRDRPRGREYV